MALPFSNEEMHTDPITPGILAQDQGSTTESWQGCRGEQWGVWGLWTPGPIFKDFFSTLYWVLKAGCYLV